MIHNLFLIFQRYFLATLVKNKAKVFAEQLYYTMKGLGTDEDELSRLIVTHATEMRDIKQAFLKKSDESLRDFIIVIYLFAQ